MKNIKKINKLGQSGLIAVILAAVLVVITMLPMFSKFKFYIDFDSAVTYTVDHNITTSVDIQKLQKIIGEKDYINRVNVEYMDESGNFSPIAVADLLRNYSDTALFSGVKRSVLDTNTFLTLHISGFMVQLSLLYLLLFMASFCIKLKKCDTPFSREIADSIKSAALSALPLALTLSVFSATKALCQPVAFTINYVKINVWMFGVFSLDIVALFCGLFMILATLLLSRIFRYGRMLQQESDETL